MLTGDPLARGLVAMRRTRAQVRRRGVAAELAAGERWALARVDQRLAERPTAAAVVLAGGRAPQLARLLRAGHPAARVSVVHAASAAPTLHAVLASIGPLTAIVVTLEAVAGLGNLAATFRALLFHLAPGGQLIFADARLGEPAPRGVWPLVTRLVALHDPAAGPPANADEQALARATRAVTVAGRAVAVTRGGSALAKLREPEVDHLLRVRGVRAGTVLDRVPPESYESRAVVRDHRACAELRAPARVEVPALTLREYRGAVVAPRQITVLDNVLLPDTYRHPLRRRLRTSGTTEVGPLFARVDADLAAAEPVDFPVYQLDSEWSGHFGHLMTEQLARLWGWAAAKRRHPDLRAVIYKKRATDRPAPWELGLFGAAGIAPGDIHVIAAPVRPPVVVAATPMFSQPEYASPRLAATWAAVGAAAAAGAAPGPHRRVFLTRERPGRHCHNRDAVERMFADAGFAVVLPERLPFADQVALVRDAQVVAGFAGSAMFTLALAGAPKRVLLVCSEGYVPHNEYLIAGVLGHEVDVFWSEPDSRAVNAAFRLDPDREGRALRRVLAALPAGG